MFWSAPSLPIEKNDQEWLEQTLLWMLDEFGKDYFLNKPTILPRHSFFPDKYRGTEECVRTLTERICQYMDVDFRSLHVELFEAENCAAPEDLAAGESQFSGAAGLFHQSASRKKMAIQISYGCLQNHVKLVATIAHELGHVRLLGERRVAREHPDHEYITDLVTVFLGMGIFTANAAFQFHQWQETSRQGWSVARAGYMSEAMFGYSLAAYCFMRGEAKPRWKEELAMNVQHYFKKSLAYLNGGGSTVLTKLR